MDVIQSEYGWTDEEVLGLPLARVVQIRDAVFLRNQVSMHARHREIEWQVKHIATVMVQTTLTEKQEWKKGYIKNVFEWDMDPDSIEQEKLEEEQRDLSSDESIEKMWAEGAQKAMEINLSKPSFGSARLG